MEQVIVIGGTDSSGGAGLSRDIATLASLGVTALPVVTDVTAQTDQRVKQIQHLSVDLIESQLKCAFKSDAIGAIKIGMLGTAKIVTLVVDMLSQCAPVPIVLDPVLISSSGTRLLDVEAEDVLRHLLFPLCEVVTPNLLEAAMLTGVPIGDGTSTLEKQAVHFRAMGVPNVLIKGGHSSGETVEDVLFDAWGDHVEFVQNRHPGTMRGTGCMLASAIAGANGARGELKISMPCGAANGWTENGDAKRLQVRKSD